MAGCASQVCGSFEGAEVYLREVHWAAVLSVHARQGRNQPFAVMKKLI